MDDNTELSFDELKLLAATDPKAWVATYIELNGLEDGPSNYSYNNCYHQALGGYVLIQVSSEGGGEGEGEHVEVTYAVASVGGTAKNGRVANSVAYVEWNGCYDSYNGTEWDDEILLVEPVDVMVVQYREKK